MLLSKGELEVKIAREIVGEVRNQIDKEFRQKVSPKGKRWATTKEEGRPFDIHDSIRASVEVVNVGNEINISSTKPYTGFLNYGTDKGITAREMYPEDYFPRRWSPIEDKIDAIMEKVLEEYDPGAR